MKRLILLAVFTCMTVISFGQGTTQTEYTYIKIGYKETFEKGHDVKKGYIVKTISEDEIINGVKITAALLLRETDSSLAGISLKTFQEGLLGNTTRYYCIPARSTTKKESYGWKEWNSDIKLMNESELEAVVGWMSQRYSYLLIVKK